MGRTLVPSRARNTARVCDPTRVGGGNSGAHTHTSRRRRRDDGVRRRSSHVPVLPRKSTIRQSIGRSANRKPDSNAQGTLSTYSARITYMRSGGGGASGDERRHAGTAASGSRRRRQQTAASERANGSERASERRRASERTNGGERTNERAAAAAAASGGGRRHVFPYANRRTPPVVRCVFRGEHGRAGAKDRERPDADAASGRERKGLTMVRKLRTM